MGSKHDFRRNIQIFRFDYVWKYFSLANIGTLSDARNPSILIIYLLNRNRDS